MDLFFRMSFQAFVFMWAWLLAASGAFTEPQSLSTPCLSLIDEKFTPGLRTEASFLTGGEHLE